MKKIDISYDWSFRLNGGEAYTVQLPHDFSIGQSRDKDAPSGISGGYFKGGYGVYERSFFAKRGKKYIFFCDASFGITEILINYNLVYVNKYGYNSFYADLTDYLRYGTDNILTVRVNNTWQPCARWYTGSGLYRGASLYVSDPSYIDPYGPFVYTERVDGDVAYMAAEVRFFAAQRGEGTLRFDIYRDGTRRAVHSFVRRIYATEGENEYFTRFLLEDAKLWDIDDPNMYSVKVTLTLGKSRDTHSASFGIRTVVADSRRGLLINGRSLKLHGGCIHHDNGIIGSASYPDAEYRRIAKLKEAGFNAVRLAHNPQSRHLYDACDRLGMMVIDELFDYWTDGKQANDMHAFFGDNYLLWTEQIVRANRSHPSVIIWSTGNEIPQKSGRGYGYEIAKNIADKIRSLDLSRPLIHCFCGLWDNKEEFDRENATKHLGAEVMDYYAERIAITADTVDIIGYNYMENRLLRDLVRFPDKLFINTETYALSAFTTYAQLKDEPRILGDFVWTAWDYFGETGIGHINYHYPEKDELFADRFPNHIASCGDFDICGVRKPQSYYREIAWGNRTEPYIACTHPLIHRRPYTPGAWGFYECEHSWRFDGYEGEKTLIYVFADCDLITLSVNGKEIGRQEKNERGIYTFETEYVPGKITAIAWRNGRILGVSELCTEGDAASLMLKAEPRYTVKGAEPSEDELIYVDVLCVDREGNRCTSDDRYVQYRAEGASILGTGSAHPTDLTLYTDTGRHLYRGRTTLVLRKKRTTESITLTAEAENLPIAILKL